MILLFPRCQISWNNGTLCISNTRTMGASRYGNTPTKAARPILPKTRCLFCGMTLINPPWRTGGNWG